MTEQYAQQHILPFDTFTLQNNANGQRRGYMVAGGGTATVGQRIATPPAPLTSRHEKEKKKNR